MNRRGLTFVEAAILIVLLLLAGAYFFGQQIVNWQPPAGCAGNNASCRPGAEIGSGKDCCKGLGCTENGAAPGTYQCTPG